MRATAKLILKYFLVTAGFFRGFVASTSVEYWDSIWTWFNPPNNKPYLSTWKNWNVYD